MKTLVDQELLSDIMHALNMIPNQYFTGRDGQPTESYDLAARLGNVTRTTTPQSLDVYTNGDNDQPTTCPKCGARTIWDDSGKNKQKHACLSCGYEFILEMEEE